MRRFHRTDKKTWSLLDERGTVLGSLIKPHWYSQRVELIVASGLFLVKRKRSWSRDIAVFAGDVPVMETDFSWDRTVIRERGSAQAPLTITRKSWFSSVHEIKDDHGVLRAQLRTRINWNTFQREPELLQDHHEPLEPLKLLFALQAIITQHDRSAGAAI